MAVSMPSRVIIRSVKTNTPNHAEAPTFMDDCSSRPSMSLFM
jgi:hypothetical protein